MTNEQLKAKCKGRTEEQQKVIKYFNAGGGCFSKKNISDEEYDQMVKNKVASLNLKQKALDKLGIDESQVKEIPPCELPYWYFEKNKTWSKTGIDDHIRSSAYQVTWLFFSHKQVYIYQYIFNMDEDGKKEKTGEYFWKDITNFSTTTEDIEVIDTVYKGCMKNKPVEIRKTKSIDRFKLIVPGDTFECNITLDSDAENKVKAMKNKLREMKS